jgi:hypothetical protein
MIPRSFENGGSTDENITLTLNIQFRNSASLSSAASLDEELNLIQKRSSFLIQRDIAECSNEGLKLSAPHFWSNHIFQSCEKPMTKCIFVPVRRQ